MPSVMTMWKCIYGNHIFTYIWWQTFIVFIPGCRDSSVGRRVNWVCSLLHSEGDRLRLYTKQLIYLFVTLVYNYSQNNNYINRIVLKESSTVFNCIVGCSSYVFVPKMVIRHSCIIIMYISKFHLSRQTTICFHIYIYNSWNLELYVFVIYNNHSLIVVVNNIYLTN